MQTKGVMSLVAVAAGAFFLIYLGSLLFPGRNYLIESIDVVSEGDQYVIEIGFNSPVRYEGHFPTEGADLVQIDVRPVSMTAYEGVELFDRQALEALSLPVSPLEKVIYEGNVVGGPFLNLQFNKQVKYNIREGRKLQSLLVFVDR